MSGGIVWPMCFKSVGQRCGQVCQRRPARRGGRKGPTGASGGHGRRLAVVFGGDLSRGCSSSAASAGLSVSELNAEISVEAAMVKANWR